MEKNCLVLTDKGVCGILEPDIWVWTGTLTRRIVYKIITAKCYQIDFVDGSSFVLSEDTFVHCKKWSPLKPAVWKGMKVKEIPTNKEMLIKSVDITNPDLDLGMRIKKLFPVGEKECVECYNCDGIILLANGVKIGVKYGII